MTKNPEDAKKGKKVQFHLSPAEKELFEELMRKGGHNTGKSFFISLMAERDTIYKEMEKGRQVGSFSEDLKTVRIFLMPHFPK